MECLICGTELEAGLARCPKCDFPILQMVNDDIAGQNKIKEMSTQFKNNLLKEVQIDCLTYYYEQNEYKLEKEKYIRIASGNELKENKIFWYKELYPCIKRDFDITISINNAKKEKKTYNLSLENPQIDEPFKIGVCLQKNLKIILVVGNESTYTKSEPVEIM